MSKKGMLGDSESLRRIMAGPVCDLLTKLNGPDGRIYEFNLKKLLRRENVIWSRALKRNQHGHFIFEIEGTGDTGAEEVEQLRAVGFHIDDLTASCYQNNGPAGYDAKHRWLLGRKRTIALLPHDEISGSDCTFERLQALAATYGYSKASGGVIPLLRRVIDEDQMTEMGVPYVAALHDPIPNRDGDPSILTMHGGPRLDIYGYCSGYKWNDGGFSAFEVPAK